MTVHGSGHDARRVVVTGFGPVTPVATGIEEFWSALLAGRSGIDLIRSFDTADMPVKIAGEMKDFRPEDWLTPKEVKRTDRCVQIGKSTRLNSSHLVISYAVFCLKKKKTTELQYIVPKGVLASRLKYASVAQRIA